MTKLIGARGQTARLFRGIAAVTLAGASLGSCFSSFASSIVTNAAAYQGLSRLKGESAQDELGRVPEYGNESRNFSPSKMGLAVSAFGEVGSSGFLQLLM